MYDPKPDSWNIALDFVARTTKRIIGTGSSTQKSEPIYLSPMIASVVYMKKITRKSVKHLVCR